MKRQKVVRKKNMHYENNDFYAREKEREGKRRWIVVHFYKFEFVLTRQKVCSCM